MPRRKHEIIGLHYYQGVKDGDVKMGNYLKYLDRLNVSIITKPLKEIKINNQLSGDSDFDYVVKKLRSVGKRITVFSSKRVLSWELKLAANKFEYLEKYRTIFSR